MKFSLGNYVLELRRRDRPIEPLNDERPVPGMTELELDAAFSIYRKHRLYQAVQQLLRTAEDNSHLESGIAMEQGQANIVFAKIGAAEICKSLRSDFANRRDRGLPALRRVKPKGRGPYEEPEEGDEE